MQPSAAGLATCCVKHFGDIFETSGSALFVD